MGTSQSSTGPGGGSPLVPAWADDQPQQPLPPPEAARFAPFRKSLGSAVSSGNRDDFRKAIGHYARKASGGGGTAARRMGSITQAGAGLFGALAGLPAGTGEISIDLGSLAGLPCELAISSISQALTTEDGDSEKIRAAMNHALVEALDGVETFDPQCISDEVIVKVQNLTNACCRTGFPLRSKPAANAGVRLPIPSILTYEKEYYEYRSILVHAGW